jgi:hypothetical protein
VKLIVMHAIEIEADAIMADIRHVVLAASRSFVSATAPVGTTRLVNVKGATLVLAGVANEQDLAALVLEAVTR